MNGADVDLDIDTANIIEREKRRTVGYMKHTQILDVGNGHYPALLQSEAIKSLFCDSGHVRRVKEDLCHFTLLPGSIGCR